MNNSRLAYLLQYGCGFLTGLAIGLWCIDTGMRQAREAEPDFPVLTAEPYRPTHTIPLAP